MELTIPLLLLAALALVVAVVLRNRGRLNLKRVAQSSLPALPAVRCFKCGKQMEEGFVMIGGMNWRSFNSSPRKVTGSGENLENICQDQSLLIFNRGVPENRALRCSNCLVVTVDHSQLFVIEKK